MDWTGLITLGTTLLSSQTAKSAPNIPAQEREPMTTKSLSEYLPEIDEIMATQGESALSMLKGELPQGVVDQIKMFAGESAMRGGYGSSSDRVGNVVARDLGLSALDMMETGQQYANYLVNQAQSMQTYNADMSYQAWADNAQNRWKAFETQSNRQANLYEGLLKGASQLSTSAYITKKEDKKAQQDALDKKADSGKAHSIILSLSKQ